MAELDDPSKPAEFWEEEAGAQGEDLRKHLVRWVLVFAGLCAAVFFTIWWASSAVRFSASRVTASTAPSYRVSGVVRDARSGAPIPWAEIGDDPAGQPPFFRTTADRFGAFALLTIAEVHRIRVSALGYKPSMVQIGKAWFQWLPWGRERLNIALQPE